MRCRSRLAVVQPHVVCSHHCHDCCPPTTCLPTLGRYSLRDLVDMLQSSMKDEGLIECLKDEIPQFKHRNKLKLQLARDVKAQVEREADAAASSRAREQQQQQARDAAAAREAERQVAPAWPFEALLLGTHRLPHSLSRHRPPCTVCRRRRKRNSGRRQRHSGLETQRHRPQLRPQPQPRRRRRRHASKKRRGCVKSTPERRVRRQRELAEGKNSESNWRT